MLGLITIGALEVISSVYPSGAAFATRSDPMLPPAPPRLSITNGFPSSSCRPFAIGRAAVSDGPPGGHGTIIVTGFDGLACAQAIVDTNEITTVPTAPVNSPSMLVSG